MILDLLLTLLLAETSWRLLESPARRVLRASHRRMRAAVPINP
jgi:peptidoglycan/LPS O-acetylase OafA/YrhL